MLQITINNAQNWLLHGWNIWMNKNDDVDDYQYDGWDDDDDDDDDDETNMWLKERPLV